MDEDVEEVLPEVLVDEDEPSSAIKLCRLDASLPGPPAALAASVEPLEDEELLLPWACNAAIRLCRKPLIAWPASEVLEEVLLESEPVALLDAAALLESLVPVMPIFDKASAIAPIKPPPAPPGGGGGMLPTLLLELLLPDCELHPICDVE
ncbi:MAG TPA: hypothetical protein VF450_21520 [Noviherbaspirillum sp.]